MESKLDRMTGRNKSLQKAISIFPKSWRLKTNPDRFAIEKFISVVSKKLSPGEKILDAGAGYQPYKKFFNHCSYESTDFDNFEGLSFTCSLDKIPKKNNTYDALISTEVLEHVEDPQKVVKEFRRVLKKGGKLFLTVPQGRTIHQEPYNFFYFTKYGVELILKNAGFKKYSITAKGGYFWFLADAIRFNEIADQYKENKPIFFILKCFSPITSVFIPLILFHLDFIDKKKKWTCGYLVEAEK